MSKELEALYRIKNTLLAEGYWQDALQDSNIIETALKEYEAIKDVRITARFDLKQVSKEHRALEIIKKKKVNLEYLKCCETYEQYKTICSYWNEMTQEDFALLKEVFL